VKIRTCISCGEKPSEGYKDGLQPESLADGNWLVKRTSEGACSEREHAFHPGRHHHQISRK
jgi:hypothetical protein